MNLPIIRVGIVSNSERVVPTHITQIIHKIIFLLPLLIKGPEKMLPRAIPSIEAFPINEFHSFVSSSVHANLPARTGAI